jgi:lambda repressor-like predicted transcriptional regulator
VGFSRQMGVGELATRAEGARKVDGRWTEGGQRTPASVSSSKRPPRRVRPPSSGFSAGSQRVSRRCSEGAPFVGSPANGSTWTRFRPVPAEPTHVRCPYGADIDSGRARGVSPIPEFGGFTLNDERLRPVIGRGGLVVVLKRDQILTACAARGLSLEELRLAAGISRPTLQAALRGKRVRPRTALKLARALNRHPVLEEIGLLLEAS